METFVVPVEVPGEFYFAGGPLPFDAESYVVRRPDVELYETLSSGSYGAVLAPRQCGKTSLAIRTAAKLRQAGIAAGIVDLSKVAISSEDAERWYDSLILETAKAMGLRNEGWAFVRQFADTAPSTRFFDFLTEIALPATEGRCVLFLDALEALTKLPFATDDLLSGIRELWDDRATDSRLRTLSVCLLGSADPQDLIEDPRRSPFSIAKAFELEDFTILEAARLASGLGENRGAMLHRIFHWTAGHPYLTHAIAETVAQSHEKSLATVDQMVAHRYLGSHSVAADPHLAAVASDLQTRGGPSDSGQPLREMLALYSQVLAGKVMDDETSRPARRLKLVGLVRSRFGELHIRNRIYERAFNGIWLGETIPSRKRARRSELPPAATPWMLFGGLALIALAGYGAAALRHWVSTKHTESSSLAHQLYIAQTGLMRQAWDSSNLSRLRELLNETRKSPDRGWEWGYWNRLAYPTGDHAGFTVQEAAQLKLSQNRKYAVVNSGPGTIMFRRAGAWKPVTIPKWMILTALAVDNEGTRIAVGDAQGRLTVLDSTSGKVLEKAGSHSQRVNDVEFSPDGTFLASSSGTWFDWGDLQLWSLKWHRQMWRRADPSTAYWTCDFSSDGRYLLAACQRNGNGPGAVLLSIWGGRAVRSYASASTTWCATFAPGGSTVVTGDNLKRVVAWDLASGKMVNWFDVPSAPVRVEVGPSGSIAASLSNGNSLVHQTGLSLPATSSLIPTDGGFYLGLRDHHVMRFDLATAGEMQGSSGGGTTQTPFAVCDDGRTVFMARDRGAIQRYELPHLAPATSRAVPAIQVSASADGKTVVGATVTGEAFVLDGQNLRLTSTVSQIRATTPDGAVAAVLQVSKDGKRLLSTAPDGFAALWSLPDGKLIRKLGTDRPTCSSACFVDGLSVLVADGKGGVALYEQKTGKRTALFKIGQVKITSIAAAPVGHTFAIGRADGGVEIWSMDTQSRLVAFHAHSTGVNSLEFSANGQRLLTSGDSAARLFDVATGADVLDLAGSNFVYDAQFLAGENMIVSSGWGPTPCLWRADFGLRTALK